MTDDREKYRGCTTAHAAEKNQKTHFAIYVSLEAVRFLFEPPLAAVGRKPSSLLAPWFVIYSDLVLAALRKP